MKTFSIRNLSRKYLLVFLVLTCLQTMGQQVSEPQPEEEPDLSLQTQFEGMMTRYNTYERYKVVPISELNNFWEQVKDSVEQRNLAIARLESQIRLQKTETDTLRRQLSSTRAALDESEEVNDSIDFLGIRFSKPGYHVTVWIIIGLIAAVCAFIYFLYIRSHQTTTKVKREAENLRRELNDYKDKSRETQVRLKRELQTAVNTIEELKRSGSTANRR